MKDSQAHENEEEDVEEKEVIPFQPYSMALLLMVKAA